MSREQHQKEKIEAGIERLRLKVEQEEEAERKRTEGVRQATQAYLDRIQDDITSVKGWGENE
jgi:predicted ribosome quality control (RQC) complex YloA/Tae2 family protein